MKRMFAGIAIGVGLVAAVVHAAGTEVVTNPTPAVSATMTLISGTEGCFTWNVSGKVKPAYRGHGANVKLVCQKYATIGVGGQVVFGPGGCDFDFCPANVDACGNFSFNAVVCGDSPQLDPSWFCSFVVHVDDSSAPQACSGKAPIPDAAPPDPNGSAPCSGGACPIAP